MSLVTNDKISTSGHRGRRQVQQWGDGDYYEEWGIVLIEIIFFFSRTNFLEVDSRV